ncbi:ABC transporter ATP-binding protein [Halomonas dongshanensis]|uniref:ABC transporter ATP-binding protein n=1 Tax=Halomonas dongshanensis TaxID=2890835 RepID=A0ABT2EAH8_9GAMM|nr:ABC transporter ATP-binding protein [Halomonas dongshanensis]MCS2608571.1 ABC transporter ATP-binding protein [Halomonas dongshanensis]
MPPALPSALAVHKLCVSFGNTPLLDDISFELPPGGRLALLGESGSGKSMTARAALGLLPSHATVSGAIAINAIDVTSTTALSRPLDARPAMVMQDTLAALNPLATIGYQLEGALRHQKLKAKARRDQAATLLTQVGFHEPKQILKRCSAELSGGQRQRVCIAMALACQAPVIIADEPTSALDVVTQAQILRLLHDVSAAPSGPALLFITHDLHAATHLCQEALILDAGRVVERGPMQHLVTSPQHPHTQRLIESARVCGIACERLYA